MVALLSGIPCHVLGGFGIAVYLGDLLPGRAVPQVEGSPLSIYIYVKLLGVLLLESQHVLPPLGLSADGREAHANTQSYPILQRTFKPQLQDTIVPNVIAQQYGFSISFLEKDHRKQKNNPLNSPICQGGGRST